jgi:hypothetical protein
VKGNTLSSRLQPPVRRRASIKTNHITRPAAITMVGAPPNSQPASAALRTLRISTMEAANVMMKSSTSYHGIRSSGDLSELGKIRNVNGSINAISR